jgi:hypothetical protein
LSLLAVLQGALAPLAPAVCAQRSTYAQIYPHHQKPVDECLKKNNLARNAELGVTIPNTTRNYLRTRPRSGRMRR